MKHVILGAGAIGGLVATALSSLGEDVTLIVRHEKLAAQPTTLTATSPTGTISAPVKLVSRLTEHADVLWIATKTYQLDDALVSIEVVPRIIVPLLNGIDHIAVLRGRYGHDRVVPATIAVEAERSSRGHYVHQTPVRLNLAASGEPMLAEIVTRLQGLGWSCRFIANEDTLIWSKLCFLEPMLSGKQSSRRRCARHARWRQNKAPRSTPPKSLAPIPAALPPCALRWRKISRPDASSNSTASPARSCVPHFVTESGFLRLQA